MSHNVVQIDWSALEFALQNNAPGHRYLDLSTGRVITGGKTMEPDRYARIEPVSPKEQYRWMERFLETVEEPVLRERLARSLDGGGAFRRFKDLLLAHASEFERWRIFRREFLRQHAREWLKRHHITPASLPPWAELDEPVGASPAPVEIAPPDGETAALLRRHACELLERLPASELLQALAYLRFLAAKTAATGQT